MSCEFARRLHWRQWPSGIYATAIKNGQVDPSGSQDYNNKIELLALYICSCRDISPKPPIKQLVFTNPQFKLIVFKCQTETSIVSISHSFKYYYTVIIKRQLQHQVPLCILYSIWKRIATKL